jgi:uncharacterized DUF497 family protein
VEFEWDPAKSGATFRDRGFDFAYARRVFSGSRIETLDARTDYGEVRIRAIGQVGPDILTVIYTVRGSVLRIISARRANRKERAQWLSRV